MATHTKDELRDAAHVLGRAALQAGFRPATAMPVAAAHEAFRAAAPASHELFDAEAPDVAVPAAARAAARAARGIAAALAPRGCFVTGTDTGAGKTIVAAALCAAIGATGARVAAFKPVVTGTDEQPGGGERPAPARRQRAAGVGPRTTTCSRAVTGARPRDVCAQTFGPAVSPHLAAQLAGTTIELDALVAAARAAAARADVLVVEGVGGLLVPLNARHDVRDLAVALGLPVVIAARPGLGTINHSLLTIAAARAAGLDVRAVVLTPWPAEPSVMQRSNRDTIAARGDVEVATLAATTPSDLAHAGAALPWAGWRGCVVLIGPGPIRRTHPRARLAAVAARAFLTAEWHHVLGLTWPADAALLAAHLPRGARIDELDGTPRVSLVAFGFRRTRVRGVAIPGHVTFPEINLRFYVRMDGERGVVFIREFVPRRAISVVARLLYNEPYRTIPMRHEAATTADGAARAPPLRRRQRARGARRPGLAPARARLARALAHAPRPRRRPHARRRRPLLPRRARAVGAARGPRPARRRRLRRALWPGLGAPRRPGAIARHPRARLGRARAAAAARRSPADSPQDRRRTRLIRHTAVATIDGMADRFEEILSELRTERAEMRREREEWTARIDRRQDQTDENLRFLGELNRRSEIVLRDLLRSQAQMRAEIRESIKEIKANTADIRANTETTKAHTRAIFALIDRLEGGGGGLAPAG